VLGLALTEALPVLGLARESLIDCSSLFLTLLGVAGLLRALVFKEVFSFSGAALGLGFGVARPSLRERVNALVALGVSGLPRAAFKDLASLEGGFFLALGFFLTVGFLASGDKQTATTSSFGAAFRKAKDAGQKIFTWPKGGKSYSTATKDDVKKSGSKDLRGHLNAKSGKKATSFGTAFKAAKKEGKKTFKFNGKSYSTKTK